MESWCNMHVDRRVGMEVSLVKVRPAVLWARSGFSVFCHIGACAGIMALTMQCTSSCGGSLFTLNKVARCNRLMLDVTPFELLFLCT